MTDRVAEPRPSAAFAIERQQRIFVEQIIDVSDQRQAALEIDPGAEIDQLIIGQLQVDRRRRGRRGAAKRQAVSKGARVVFLIGGLGIAGAGIPAVRVGQL